MQNDDCAFRVLDAGDPLDAKQWLVLWESWPEREVFAHPEYARLFCNENSKPLCATMRSDGRQILYPFILRDLKAEPFCCLETERASDIVSPYGYGGPSSWGEGDKKEVSSAFWKCFSNWAAERNLVSEFVRFNLFPESLTDYPGEQEEMLLNVVRDLVPDEDEIWKDFEHNVRTNVRKAERSGVSVEADPTGERLDDFLRVYYSTMNRREADESYYFPHDFFEHVRAELAGHHAFFHAFWNGRVVSTELVLLSADTAYAFLGGTDSEAFHVRPNDLLRYHIILWTRQAGKKRYVLGGGYQPDDGIFRQKRRFAPGSYAPFFVGRRVLNTHLYEQLVEGRRLFEASRDVEWLPRPGYFPAYRG